MTKSLPADHVASPVLSFHALINAVFTTSMLFITYSFIYFYTHLILHQILSFVCVWRWENLVLWDEEYTSVKILTRYSKQQTERASYKTECQTALCLLVFFGSFGVLFSSSSPACLCTKVALHMLSRTKQYCDDDLLRGHQLPQRL